MTPLVELSAIHKRFPGVYALKGVDFDVLPGEVHALVGENGAGKSTLIKVVTGVYDCEEGQYWIEGEEVLLDGPRAAMDRPGYGIPLLVPESSRKGLRVALELL